MKTSRKVLATLSLAGVAVFGLAASAAHAESTLSGTLGDLTVRYAGYAGPLNMAALADGSFYGTFSTDTLPAATGTQTALTSYSINLLDNTGNIVFTYSNTNSNDLAFVQDFVYMGQELNTLNFQDNKTGENSALQLTFAPGFTGTGTTPDATLFNGYNGLSASNSSDLSQGWDKIGIVSATASVVPLPPAAIGGLALIGVLAGATKLRRSRGFSEA